jgi:predicted transcriptional regulator
MPETLQAKSAKQGVIEMLQRLPDDCTLEQIEYHLHVYARLQQAVADIDAGRVVPHDEVKRRVEEWLTSSGPKTP